MARSPEQYSLFAWLLLAFLGPTVAIIFPSGCPKTGCGDYFLPQSEIDATCNNKTHHNRYYYDSAVHYDDAKTFLSNVFSKLTQAVVLGTVTKMYRQNFTENLIGQDQTKVSRVTQEEYMMDISFYCVLKYEKLPSDKHFFPLPQPVFWKADCPPRDVAVGDEVILSIGGAGHDTMCSWECKPVHWRFSGLSLHKKDNSVLSEILKSCGFQNPSVPEGINRNCPSASVTDNTCVNRENSASSYFSSSIIIISMITMFLAL